MHCQVNVIEIPGERRTERLHLLVEFRFNQPFASDTPIGFLALGRLGGYRFR